MEYLPNHVLCAGFISLTDRKVFEMTGKIVILVRIFEHTG